MVESIKKLYSDLPVNLRRFLLRGTILFVAWSLLYNLLLKPTEIPSGSIGWEIAETLTSSYKLPQTATPQIETIVSNGIGPHTIWDDVTDSALTSIVVKKISENADFHSIALTELTTVVADKIHHFKGWHGIPDRQLSHFIVICTAKSMSLFYNDINIKNDSHIFIGPKEAIQIAPACNGLELLVLYVGFLLCIPTTKKRFWTYAISGVVIINILNIIRCVGLAIMFYNDHPMADFAHHYLFKLAIYAVIFYIWVLYSKKYMQNA